MLGSFLTRIRSVPSAKRLSRKHTKQVVSICGLICPCTLALRLGKTSFNTSSISTLQYILSCTRLTSLPYCSRLAVGTFNPSFSFYLPTEKPWALQHALLSTHSSFFLQLLEGSTNSTSSLCSKPLVPVQNASLSLWEMRNARPYPS